MDRNEAMKATDALDESVKNQEEALAVQRASLETLLQLEDRRKKKFSRDEETIKKIEGSIGRLERGDDVREVFLEWARDVLESSREGLEEDEETLRDTGELVGQQRAVVRHIETQVEQARGYARMVRESARG